MSKTRNFGGAEFNTTVLVDDGDAFKNPLSVTVNAPAGSGTNNNGIRVEAYPTGSQDMIDYQTIPQGWQNSISVPFTQLERGKSYYFQLRNNEGLGAAKIAGGIVLYDG